MSPPSTPQVGNRSSVDTESEGTMSNTNTPTNTNNASNAGASSFSLQWLLYNKHRITKLEGPNNHGTAYTGLSVHLWLKLPERNFESEQITSEEERIPIVCCNESSIETSARLVWENCLEMRNATTFAEFKKAMIDNLAAATSTRIYDQFEELFKMQWNKSSSVTTHINQALSHFNSFCEEVEARYGVNYSPEGQRIFFLAMICCKLPNRAIKTELKKAKTVNKTITEIVAELTENSACINL